MSTPTHGKMTIAGLHRADVLRDLADACERYPVDGPVTVVYDTGLNLFVGTYYVLEQPAVPYQVAPSTSEYHATRSGS